MNIFSTPFHSSTSSNGVRTTTMSFQSQKYRTPDRITKAPAIFYFYFYRYSDTRRVEREIGVESPCHSGRFIWKRAHRPSQSNEPSLFNRPPETRSTRLRVVMTRPDRTRHTPRTDQTLSTNACPFYLYFKKKV